MKASRRIRVSRQLAALWGPRGRQLVEDLLRNLPPGFDAIESHVVLLDVPRQQATWAASRNAVPSVTENEISCHLPEKLLESTAADILPLRPLFLGLARGRPLDRMHCFPLGRGNRVAGLLVIVSPPRSLLSVLRRYARLAGASLVLMHNVVTDLRELEGYRALSHLLDVGATHDRRSLARALGRSIVAVTRARMCLILARGDPSQPLTLIGSRGYPQHLAHSLVIWPQEEPWASTMERDAVAAVATRRLDAAWREVVGPGRVLLVPVRWKGSVRCVLVFPADTGKTGGTHLLDPAQLGGVGAQGALLWQNTELIQRLRRDEEVLKGLMQRSIQVQEEERRRIASDIHDGLTQRIVGIWYRLLALEKLLGLQQNGRHQEVKLALDTIKAQVDLTMREARAAIYNLRPSTLDDLGLIPSLRSLGTEFRVETGVDVVLEVRGERRLPDFIEVGIYRIAQEALRNIHKHAHATRVGLLLQMGEDTVRLTVSDNGRGFQRKKRVVGAALKSFGLESMEERAQMLGAQLILRSTPGEGTSVRVSIPIPKTLEIETPR